MVDLGPTQEEYCNHKITFSGKVHCELRVKVSNNFIAYGRCVTCDIPNITKTLKEEFEKEMNQ